MLLVSLAGPAANLVMALAASILLGVGLLRLVPFAEYVYYILYLTLQINVILAFFNLIPVPPLDGSKILAGLFPGNPILFTVWRHTAL